MIDIPVAFAGIDWGSRIHQVCVIDPGGTRIGEQRFAHSGAGLAAMAGWILGLTGSAAGNIATAIETSQGPVIEGLLERGFAVYAINPRQLDRFRDRFSPSGSKDDRRDAAVLAGALRTDVGAFRRLQPAEPLVVRLRECSRLGDDLARERTRLVHRLRNQLWRYYPQFLELDDDLAKHWMLDLWEMAPDPDAARELSRGRVTRLLKRSQVRRISAIEVTAILGRPSLRLAPGTAEAAALSVGVIVERLRLVLRQQSRNNSNIEALTAALARELEGGYSGHRDVAILSSLPGVGRMVLATLLAEAYEPLQRRDYHALRTLSGAAPVTRQSGSKWIVSRRLAANAHLVNAIYHWARVAIQRDPGSRARYDALRERGCKHARALRQVADRLLAVACAMLRDQTMYRPELTGRQSATNT